jgi:hypothetical protein
VGLLDGFASAPSADKPVNDQQGDEQRECKHSFGHVSSFRCRLASERTPGLTGPDQARRPEESDVRSGFPPRAHDVTVARVVCRHRISVIG